MIDIINRQRKRKFNAKHWREFTAESLRAIKREGCAVSIVFVSNAAIRKLNKQFRGKDYATDVLSFPTESEQFENQSSLGEIVIATERAVAQARENGLTGQNEIE
ncbi:MAG TPA: rRNA maturation RNase YbeY, partial [Pyrinomonadaceae bacterium]|nr:rRNA maturation RNase YbeY [Pyrinomonadaceae bacterium]